MKKIFTLLIASLLLCAIFGCKEVTVETVTCNVSYQREGGDSTIVLPNNQEVEQFSKIKLPTYDSLENWNFMGWFVNGEKITNNEYVINEDTIFVAKFEKLLDIDNSTEQPPTEEPTDKENPDVDNPTEHPPLEEPTDKEPLYNVYFQSNLDVVLPENMVVEKGTVIEKPINPTKEDYVFWEWTVNGEKITFPYTINDNIVIFANFKEKDIVEEFKSQLEYLYNYKNPDFLVKCHTHYFLANPTTQRSLIHLLTLPDEDDETKYEYMPIFTSKNGIIPNDINIQLDDIVSESKKKFYEDYKFTSNIICYISEINIDINNLIIFYEENYITKNDLEKNFKEERFSTVVSESIGQNKIYQVNLKLSFNSSEYINIYNNLSKTLGIFKRNYENYLYEIENR